MKLSDRIFIGIILTLIILILNNFNARISILEHNFDGAIAALVNQ